ncbi:3144_t:CDS:2 [Paraglomus occultum]|uniref:3144_t:CDS:1 n=1 Tax=Paraglomus occultum TaxID=144539 RepID=A0A9N8ZU76_9GLOM|nr:3144_t:CDS:2 [Paraglomus occultum]
MFEEKSNSIARVYFFSLASNYGRILSRKNNAIRALLLLLIISTSVWLLYSKPWAATSLSQDAFGDKTAADTVNETSQSKEQIDLNVTINSRTSAFTREQFTEKALSKNGLIPVTAVLLGWKRLEGLQIIVSYISKYPFIKEIIRDFTLNNTDVVLHVFNSDENLHDLSKYTTCAMATYDYCYFQDDDWLNLYMDSIYSNFLRSPNLIHSNTMPIIHLEHRRWTFTNADKKLHTGFTWLGCGSFVPRAKVQQFLRQVGSTAMPKDRLRLLDMYFSLWTNQYPYQLSNPLTPLEQEGAWSTGVDQWAIVYANILDAVQRLFKALAVNTGSEYYVRDEERPMFNNRDVRAPCTNDKCLFLTNIDPFPSPRSVYYANNITHVHEQEARFNRLNFPSNDFWDKHAYHTAVDTNVNTCWNSFKNPKSGDYFGLQFVVPRKFNKITLTSSKDISKYDASFNIHISDNGRVWKTCNRRNLTDKENEEYLSNSQINSITIYFDCGTKGEEPTKFVKISTSRNFPEPLEICSIKLDGLEV